MLVLRASLLLVFAATAAGHSNLISPKPRNAIDMQDPRWFNGGSPDNWTASSYACSCRNGSEPTCDVAQTCLWMSVGCSLGCASCDGGAAGGANPNSKDRCGTATAKGLQPWTNNDPLKRTFNRECNASCIGTARDGGRWNPWRAPGAAPTYDACGRAGGGPKPTPGKGEYVNTAFAKFGDMGSKLPKQPSGAVWKAGTTVETMFSIRANHGGGYQYRLCPLKSNLTENCFRQTPMPFASDSKMMMANGEMLQLKSTFVNEGTTPAGSTWQMNPIPMVHDYFSSNATRNHGGFPFPPPCDDPYAAAAAAGKLGLKQGLCTGEWITNITIYDYLTVPANLDPGEYVLGFRWDCESSAQVWAACADVTITN